MNLVPVVRSSCIAWTGAKASSAIGHALDGHRIAKAMWSTPLPEIRVCLDVRDDLNALGDDRLQGRGREIRSQSVGCPLVRPVRAYIQTAMSHCRPAGA
jgi:hypothetical protein